METLCLNDALQSNPTKILNDTLLNLAKLLLPLPRDWNHYSHTEHVKQVTGLVHFVCSAILFKGMLWFPSTLTTFDSLEQFCPLYWNVCLWTAWFRNGEVGLKLHIKSTI